MICLSLIIFIALRFNINYEIKSLTTSLFLQRYSNLAKLATKIASPPICIIANIVISCQNHHIIIKQIMHQNPFAITRILMRVADRLL